MGKRMKTRTRMRMEVQQAALVVLVMAFGGYVTGELNDDVLGLIVFKADLQDPKNSLSTWNEDDDTPCSWKYVECGGKGSRRSSGGRVTQLTLSNVSVSGRIGRGLAKLEYLQVLDLSFNNLSGPLSPDLLRISELRILDLGHNSLSGSMPDNVFSKCTSSLRVLSLPFNSLRGMLPSAIQSCASLTYLNLSSNHLSGPLPSQLWLLKELRTLDLSYNYFSGSIPTGIGALSSLRDIRLSGNNFSGTLPSDFGDCLLLKIVELSDNAFEGSLPDSLQRLGMVTSMSFSANKVAGNVPLWIGNLHNLESLDLSRNSFEGELPQSLSSLQNLMLLNLSHNKLSGPLSPPLASCSSLATLDLSHNAFQGSLQREVFELGLLRLMLASNNLSGTIPPSASPRFYRFLQELDLSHNSLTGPIPSSVTRSVNLQYVNLSGNLISSEIPVDFGNLKSLKWLDLSYNHLVGGIPEKLGDATDLSVLKLDGNYLTGPIPGQIGKCTKLALLSLSHNNLTGNVPRELARLHRLRILNLSTNNLSGELPQQLGNLGSLMAVNVSHNRLKGRIPTGGIFNTLNNTALEGNAGLCGSGVNVTCPMVMPKPIVLNPNSSSSVTGKESNEGGKSKHSKIVLSVSAIIAISAAAAIAFGVVAVTILNIRAQSSSRSLNHVLDSFSQSPSTDMTLGKLVMFSPSLDPASDDWVTSAHSLLNKDCELGRGGFGTVYRAVLGDGRIVAIKKLMVSSMVKSQDDFEREVQVLGKIKHPNLVSLHGYYWTPQLQLLIYEYIQNGSLYARLHEKSSSMNNDSPLSWSVRYHIALGIARGLAHLHHTCRPPVIHYNIKSSNVLLDEEFNPKIADYGLAKLLPMLDRYILSSKIQSALGYMAPEFACQSLKINERCDVYGFGVLLLELVTGRRPVEYMEDDVIILCDHVRSLLEEGKALSCVDASMSTFPEEEVIPVLKLGLVCTSQVPSNRPAMPEVLHILELIKSPSQSTHSN